MHDNGLFEAMTPWLSIAICISAAALSIMTIAGRGPLSLVTGQVSLPLRTPQTVVASFYAFLSVAGLLNWAQAMFCPNLDCF